MRRTSLFFLFSLFSYFLTAQSLAGDYFIPTAKGEIGLELQAAGADRYTGHMIDEEGARFPLQATVSATGMLQGTISGQAGQMTFQAYGQGAALQFSLIPLNANGQPDYGNPIDFAMQRRPGASAPRPSVVNAPAGAVRPSNTPPPSAVTPRTPTPSGTTTTPPPAAPGYAPAQPYNPSASYAPASPAGPLGRSAAPAPAWSGAYRGNVNGTPSVLHLRQQGTVLSGDIDAGGYRYVLQGNALGGRLTGKVTDPQTGTVLDCSGALEGDRLTLNIQIRDPNTGGTQPMQVQFARSSSAGGPLQATPGMGADIGVRSAMPERDARLLGAWSYSDAFGAGQYQLILQADGSYLYTTGAGNGGYQRGQWKTQSGNLHINDGTGWRPYAGYYVDGVSLLLKFADGNQQVWKKN